MIDHLDMTRAAADQDGSPVRNPNPPQDQTAPLTQPAVALPGESEATGMTLSETASE
jgi:hypothetical protein